MSDNATFIVLAGALVLTYNGIERYLRSKDSPAAARAYKPISESFGEFATVIWFCVVWVAYAAWIVCLFVLPFVLLAWLLR